MINRYTLPKMGTIWDERNKFQKMLDVEVLACEAYAKLGKVPAADLARIKKRAGFKVERINEIERETNHDLIAFLTNVAEYVGPSSRFIHLGMTSSDVLDTGLSVMCKEAAEIIIKDIERLLKVLARKARKYKLTPMMGRSHGVHAEPVTFGLKMALFYDEMKRNLERMKQAKEIISVGKISGAVGTYANIPPSIESYVCRKLGLKPARISTQIVQRDRHAEFLSAIAIVGATLEKLATEIRNLQRTEILEVEEAFVKGQKGSSAMPHKRNPITCERIAGLARILRGNALAGMENVALWHERDITHSSVERVIIPDSTILINYMLTKMADVMERLLVYPKNMLRNLNLTNGLIFSQRILLALVEKGMSREEAYEIVQRCSMAVWKNGVEFKEELLKDKEVCGKLKQAEIDGCFDIKYHMKNVERIFRRVGV